MRTTLITLLFLSILVACKKESNPKVVKDNMSYAQIDKAKITHLSWNVTVDFNQKIINGSATYNIENNQSKEIIFDTENLSIDSVLIDNDEPTTFKKGKKNAILGTPLSITIKPNTKKVSIYYKTSPLASALQWLSPQQTHDKKSPFLLTQGQAILTRSYIPIQDTPSIRITYDATVKVPNNLMAVMSAINPKEKNNTGEYKFSMPQAIPPYLMALAVGDLKYKAIDNRSGVYAEPGQLETAAWEFADTGKMIDEAEKLYGKYLWEQYDILVLPPSFPFGGMENPRLTFVTPTVIAGDRSLVSLIAHELAHSWSGNLVTNATWDDFWLNEGFTVYFERRIMEAIEGKPYAEMLDVIGFQDLQTSMELEPKEFTSLKVNLKENGPDDAFSDVPYDKGYLFLRMLEDRYGRENFDAFIKTYFKENAFKTMTTESFVEYLTKHLTNGEDDFVQEWIYNTGWPKEFKKPTSERFNLVEKRFQSDLALSKENKLITEAKPNWSTMEWLHYIRLLNDKNTKEEFALLDKAYNFTQSKNAEIAAVWFEKSLLVNYDVPKPETKSFLIKVGRRKFLEPIYLAMINSGQKDFALEVYKEARPNYHSVSYNTIDELLNYKP